MDDDQIVIDLYSVTIVFKSVNEKKEMGPDNLSAFLIKTFAFACWASAFSAGQRLSPRAMEKKSIIIPLPQKSTPRMDNDYLPVALSASVLKPLEEL